jgi:GNAT superfamily N-acetyltransferase
VVRALRPDDRSAVASLLTATQSFRPDETAVAIELFDLGTAPADESPRDPDYHWIGVQDQAELVGVACFGPTPATEATFDLYWIAVAPRHQGCGIGGALLAQVESAVNQLGGHLLVIETSSASLYETPRAFYTARGYTLRATIRDYFGPSDDRLVLARPTRECERAGEH